MTTNTDSNPDIQWGLSWSGRWHALKPDYSQPVSLCSGSGLYVADEKGRYPHEFMNVVAQAERTPVCKRCEKKVGPKGGVVA